MDTKKTDACRRMNRAAVVHQNTTAPSPKNHAFPRPASSHPCVFTLVLRGFLRIVPEGAAVSPELRDAIAATRFCRTDPCALLMIDDRRAIIAGHWRGEEAIQSQRLAVLRNGKWSEASNLVEPVIPPVPVAGQPNPAAGTGAPDLATAPVELRTVERRQLHIDGKPVGDAFE